MIGSPEKRTLELMGGCVRVTALQRDNNLPGGGVENPSNRKMS